MIIQFSSFGGSSGGGSGTTYTAGEYIQISGNTISSTGLTSEAHTEESEEVIAGAFDEINTRLNSKLSKAAIDVEGAELPSPYVYPVGTAIRWIDDQTFEEKGVYILGADYNWYRLDTTSAGGEYLPELSTLPETPVDGAIYNYKGTLIQYVDGAGNWGEWVISPAALRGASSTEDGLGTSAVLNYAVIPSSMDGQVLAFATRLYGNPLYFFYDATNEKINVSTDAGVTSATVTQVSKDGVAYNCNNSNNKWVVTWTEGRIEFRKNNNNAMLSETTPVSASTAHYELVNPSYGSMSADTSAAVVYVDNLGRVTGKGVNVQYNDIKINNSAAKIISVNGSSVPNFYAPTASGESGTVLVSAGNTVPVWQTLQSALGIQAIWTGTQDQYEALGTYSNTTLYFIVEED